MSQIFIEARTATFLGVPVSQKHLYLVYRDDGGSEWVIRGGPDGIGDLFGGDFLFEINREIDLSSDARGSDTPADRFSTELIIPGKSGDEIWAIMVKYALLLDEVDYPYHSLSTNSNALIGALITAAGGSALGSLPTGVSLSEVFGYDSYSQIVADVVPPLDGSIVGTNQADPIVGIQIAEVFYGLGGNDVIFANAGNDTVYGGSDNDQIRGGPGNDILDGGAGNDTLNGGAGEDFLIGGGGSDTYVVNSAGDVVAEAAGAGTDLIQSSVSIALLAANVEKLALTGVAAVNGTGNTLANTITGNAVANTLSGSGGNDRLLGSGGNDVLRGGTGRDTLTGGTGLDKYDFNSALNAATNKDTITAYSLADDLIRLDDDIFTTLTLGNLPGAAFYKALGATVAHDASDRIIYNSTNGNLYYDADGTGASYDRFWCMS
jgi:Ca2+-binding RTX toxin-like protein